MHCLSLRHKYRYHFSPCPYLPPVFVTKAPAIRTQIRTLRQRHLDISTFARRTKTTQNLIHDTECGRRFIS